MEGHDKKSMKINTKDIAIDKNGQRDVEARKAEFNYIMKNYNPDLVDPLSVAFVNGKYYLYDGQMRVKVVKAKHGGKDVSMKAEVVYGCTLPEVADLFLAKNDPKGRADTKLSDRIRVAANYGSQDEMNFIRIMERNNFRIDRWNTSVESGVLIQATKTIWDEYHKFASNEDFDTFLYILYYAFAHQKMGTTGKIIKGLGVIVRAYKDEFLPKIMAESLRKISPVDIITCAEGGKKRYSAVDYAYQMLLQYNKGRSRFKLDEGKLRGAE